MPFDFSGLFNAMDLLLERDALRRAGVGVVESIWLTDGTGRTLEEVREGMRYVPSLTEGSAEK